MGWQIGWSSILLKPLRENKFEPFPNYAEVLHILLYNLSLHGPHEGRHGLPLKVSENTKPHLSRHRTDNDINDINLSMMSIIKK